jgi:hypothetical protein
MRLASPPTTARQRADDLGGKTVDQRQQRVLGAAGEAGVVVGSFLAWLMRSTKSRAKGSTSPDAGKSAGTSASSWAIISSGPMNLTFGRPRRQTPH